MVKKKIPQFEAFPEPVRTGVVSQKRTYQLITPLFGGGVNPGEVDTLTPIRGSEIRGHLRFWWRACRGGQWGDDLQKLRDAENKIWGKAHKKGDSPVKYDDTVHIQVDIPKDGEERPIKPFRNNLAKKRSNYVISDIPAYAAFPLQTSQEEFKQADPPERSVTEKIIFVMTITFPEKYKKDIEASLWAWETFGGIGARTRRGFGALECTGIKENDQPQEVDLPLADQGQAHDWLQRNIKEYVAKKSWHKDIPHLSHQLISGKNFRLITRPDNKALKIWNDLINSLYEFRQKRRQGKLLKNGKWAPGRSLWPEPSTIRFLINQTFLDHQSPIPNPAIHKFPRAEFGLPIIFKFMDDKQRSDRKDVDPRKTVLQPQEHERFASPLILKPLACRENKAIGLAFILDGTRPGKVPLELKAQVNPQWTDKERVTVYLDEGEELTIQSPDNSSPIHIDHQTDILQSFLRYL